VANVQWYVPACRQRAAEIDYCVRAMLGNASVDEAVVFVPSESLAAFAATFSASAKTRVIPLPAGSRMKYSDVTAKATRADTLYIIANSDIVIPPAAVAQMKSRVSRAGRPVMLCLSRWESSMARDPARNGDDPHARRLRRPDVSQDVWAFRGGSHIASLPAAFPLGVPGCDNRFAWLLSRVGSTANPSLTIRTLHIHESTYRSYTERNRLKGSYLFVDATR
jgi:hypothetical protein